jgi:hypothetical protein
MSKQVGVRFEDDEYAELYVHARAKGHGGQYVVSNFIHYAVFQYMAKYKVTDEQRDKYLPELKGNKKSAQAVQPDGTGKPSGAGPGEKE